MVKSRSLFPAASAALIASAISAHAADMAMVEPAPAPMAVAPAANWTGFYAGLHAGYGSADRDWNGEVFGNPIPDELFQYDMTGGLFGAQIGYNWQHNNFVFGVEADAAWSGMDDELTELGADVVSEVEWLATIRGRAGFAWNRIFFYGTGGVAFAGVDTTAESFFDPDSASATHTGWTAGLGVEAMLTQRISLKLEYLHADFGDEDYNYDLLPFGPPGDETVGTADLDLDTIRIGVNYRF